MAVQTFPGTIATASVGTLKHLKIDIPEDKIVSVAHELAQRFFAYDEALMQDFTERWLAYYIRDDLNQQQQEEACPKMTAQ